MVSAIGDLSSLARTSSVIAPFAATRSEGFVSSVLTQAALNLGASLEAAAVDAFQADDPAAFIGRLVCSGALSILDTESIGTQPLVALCDMLRNELRKATRTDGSKLPLPPGFDGIEPLVPASEVPFADATLSAEVLSGIL